MRSVLALLVIGCAPVDADGLRGSPARWVEVERLSGEARTGFGLSVAWAGPGQWRVGAPLHGPGRVLGPDGIVLEGPDGSRLGQGLLGGAPLFVGAPGAGEVLDGAGTVILSGASAGAALARSAEGPVVLAGQRVLGPGGFDAGERLWSLAVLDGRPVAGRAAGGLAHAGGALDAPGALGRGMATCDLDGSGRDDLVVADPVLGAVHVHRDPEIATVDLAAPDTALDLGPGAGLAVRCAAGGLLVGAPDRAGGGGLAWIRDPLDDGDVRWIDGEAGGHLGHALALAHGRLLVGDPGRGEVRVLRPR